MGEPGGDGRDERDAADEQQVRRRDAQARIVRRRGGVTPPLQARRELREARDRVGRAAAAVEQHGRQAGGVRARDVGGGVVADVDAAARRRRRAAPSAAWNGRGSGFAAPTAAAVTIASNGSASPSRASTSVSETSQFATTASSRPGGGERVERGAGVVICQKRDRIGERWEHVGARDVERERVGQQRCALEPQGCERRRVVGRDAVRAVVAHLDAHRALAAREVDVVPEPARERALEARPRRLERDERAHRVERDRVEARHCLIDGGVQLVRERAQERVGRRVCARYGGIDDEDATGGDRAQRAQARAASAGVPA